MKMNNVDHVKNFYPDNYKLDLSETMRAALSKSGSGSSNSSSGSGVMSAASVVGPHGTSDIAGTNSAISGAGYVTEKLYMLLQLYLQNKGWNPSAELLQCFTDLKDNAMLPSAAYLQVLANRMTLDTQGRLILRENCKIVLPFEHFANAVMLKHMSGPHGLHLSVDATVRAVIESYTIGRENFGMEKEFIIEVVQSCPSPACRYYKNHIGISPLPFMEQQFSSVNPGDFLQHMPHLPPPPAPHVGASHVTGTSAGASTVSGPSSAGSSSSAASSSAGGGVGGEVDLSSKSSLSTHSKVPPQLQHLTKQQQNSIHSQLSQISVAAAAAAAAAAKQQQQQAAVAAAAAAAAQQQQQQLSVLIQQQQSRALAQQSIEKFSTLSPLEKQRVLSQLDLKHFDPTTMAVAAAAANLQMQGLMQSQAAAVAAAAAAAGQNSNAQMAASAAALGLPTSSPHQGGPIVSPSHHNIHHSLPPPPSHSPTAHSASVSGVGVARIDSSNASHSVEQMVQKNVETLRSNIDSLESNKDLLALHNGAWASTNQDTIGRDNLPVGQDKIVRVFEELMCNMARMKSYIRPSMCKPYGKQSESLQKTLIDAIQIVQTLRNFLPPPHIQVTSWKSESETTTNLAGGNGSVSGVVGICNQPTGAPVMGIGNGGALLSNMPTNRIENLSN